MGFGSFKKIAYLVQIFFKPMKLIYQLSGGRVSANTEAALPKDGKRAEALDKRRVETRMSADFMEWRYWLKHRKRERLEQSLKLNRSDKLPF